MISDDEIEELVKKLNVSLNEQEYPNYIENIRKRQTAAKYLRIPYDEIKKMPVEEINKLIEEKRKGR